MAALRAAGVAFEVVPGITAALAAAAENEIPLTLRGTSSAIVFATGHDVDGETLPRWAGLALAGATVAVYMGGGVAATLAARLIAAGLSPDTPAAVIGNASRGDRRAAAGRLADLAAIVERTAASGPVLFLVGDVVAAGNIAATAAPSAAAAA
jgi:uroporphyrin-III C-methyltransferase/precorrin-2 dehydrogenase/sirohydrochlorin ferrochelatase